jgi:hypothetical protein
VQKVDCPYLRLRLILRHPTTKRLEEKTCKCLCPHELFATIVAQDPHHLGKPEDVKAAWRLLQTEPFRNFRMPCEEELCFPITLHGDDGSALAHERSVHAISWSSLATHKTVWQNRFFIVALETATKTAAAEDEIWRFISWSWTCMFLGVWPDPQLFKTLNPGAFAHRASKAEFFAFKTLMICERGQAKITLVVPCLVTGSPWRAGEWEPGHSLQDAWEIGSIMWKPTVGSVDTIRTSCLEPRSLFYKMGCVLLEATVEKHFADGDLRP